MTGVAVYAAAVILETVVRTLILIASVSVWVSAADSPLLRLETQVGHSTPIEAVSLSSDHKLAATGSDGVVTRNRRT